MIRGIVAPLVVLAELVAIVSALTYAFNHDFISELTAMVIGACLSSVVGWTIPEQLEALS